MRQAIHWLICVSLITALMGCDSGKLPPIEKKNGTETPGTTSEAVPTDDKQSSNQPPVDTSKHVLVSLNVPNMT